MSYKLYTGSVHRWEFPMRLPDFIIGGGHQGRNDFPHYYLKQHPDVYAGVFKEPRYFAYEPDNPDHVAGRGCVPIKTPTREYAALFDGRRGEQMAGRRRPLPAQPVARSASAKPFPA